MIMIKKKKCVVVMCFSHMQSTTTESVTQNHKLKLKFNLKLRKMEGEVVVFHVLHWGFLTGRQFDSPLSLSPIMQTRV